MKLRVAPVDVLRWMLLPAVLLLFGPKVVQAASQNWQLTVGAESNDEAKQAMAFLPNEIWILQGDSITWTTQSHEGHTVTLLKPGQARPGAGAGCPGVQPNGAEYIGASLGPDTDPDGAGDDFTCVNSGRLSLPTPTLPADPTSFTVTFPIAGNFKFTCLIHANMNGVVHVLTSLPLPHDQSFYDAQAAARTKAIIGDPADATDINNVGSQQATLNSANEVTTGGELVGAGGGRQYLAIMRFSPSTIHVHVGDTVEWTNVNPAEPHSVTFDTAAEFPAPGSDPAPGINSAVAPDMTIVGTMTSPTDLFDSNLFGVTLTNQDVGGAPQNEPKPTRVQVTFTAPGTYNYYCKLHDELGMEGTVVVQ